MTGAPRGRAVATPGRAALALALACGWLALSAPAASATFHLMSIREVYPGTAAEPGSEYVELQMYASGQTLVAGHVVRIYGASGAVTGEDAFGADVASGANQSTVLMATPEAEAQFGMVADGSLSPPGQLDPAGGAVCWESLDCVSWGDFSGSLPSPAGQPAAPGGIPDGMALRRTISPGCPTLLEPTDDRDSSALDFSVVFPSPRPNSVPPSEHACSAPTGSNYPSGGSGAPQTRITGHPRKTGRDRTPTFRFAADLAGATFLCKLDRGRFHRCRSPFTTRRLRPGHHLFAVEACAPGGTLDPSPARWRFRVA